MIASKTEIQSWSDQRGEERRGEICIWISMVRALRNHIVLWSKDAAAKSRREGLPSQSVLGSSDSEFVWSLLYQIEVMHTKNCDRRYYY